MEMKLDTTEYSSLSSSHNENTQDLYVAGIREFCKHDFAKDFETHVGNFSASSEILSLLKIKGRSYYAVKDFQNAYQTIFLGYQDVVKKCEALKVILKNTESIIGKKSERPKTYQKQSFRSLVVGSGAMRKRLDLLSEFMLQLAGEYEINGDSKRYLTKEEKTAIVHKDLIPKWLSYKKSSFATKTEAVINSPNIQKRNQSTLEKSVTDFEKDPVNISLEYLTSKELLITENRLKKVKGQKVARQLFLGPLGSTKIPSIKMTRGNIKKAKTYIRETFPGGEGNVALSMSAIACSPFGMQCFGFLNFFAQLFCLWIMKSVISTGSGFWMKMIHHCNGCMKLHFPLMGAGCLVVESERKVETAQ